MELLKESFGIPDNLLLYLPFLLKEINSEEISQLPGFEQREHFISIGNFRHKPNADAVSYLKQKIWPLIRKELPKAQMHVYGAYAPAAITQLNDPGKGFLIKGRVSNAEEVVKNARVSLAPLRFGAGLKGKLTEAMQCGTPCVTSSAGAEAMSGNLPWNGAIEDDPEAFAKAAVLLYTHKELWKEKQKNGFDILSQRFSKTLFYPILNSRLSILIEHLQAHRRENFIGAMLSHHYNKSTYFLSKYIEVKNELEQLKKTQKPPFQA
jgi:glycosyltransferase involved in cell wall biosynthesis